MYKKESIGFEDKVLLLDIRGRRSKGTAFKPRFKGPFTVSHVTQCGNFRLKDDNGVQISGLHKKIHVKKFIESNVKDDVSVIDLANNDISIDRTQKVADSKVQRAKIAKG
ncbi:uncharacterized protein LOC124807329 [Hydra vulgaris]|uniref:uncharacterized protein LOC124807329 n=1 Tax=Hydra vulgaris TaxID=6087 RepID=UPI0032EA7619